MQDVATSSPLNVVPRVPESALLTRGVSTKGPSPTSLLRRICPTAFQPYLPSAVAIFNGILFLGTMIANATANVGSAANARQSAISPSGYAFSIWGAIYALAACCTVFQLHRSRWDWCLDTFDFWLSLNWIGNIIWTEAFTKGWGDGLWVSVALIFGGILAPLIVLHLRIGVGEAASPFFCWSRTHSSSSSAASSHGPVATLPITFFEYISVHCFVSLYMGWVSVACIVNVAVAAVPPFGLTPDWGWEAGLWSVLMQCIAALLALTMLLRRRDFVFCIPISWALFAIAKQADSPTWSAADARVSLTGKILGSLVALAIAVVWGLKLYAVCWSARKGSVGGVSSFALCTAYWPFTAVPIRASALGLVDAETAAGATEYFVMPWGAAGGGGESEGDKASPKNLSEERG